MSIPDIQSGGFANKQVLPSSVMNLVRNYLQRALDGVDGGDYTLTSKLRLLGTDKFELGGQLLYSARSVTRNLPMRAEGVSSSDWTFDPTVAGVGKAYNLTVGASLYVPLALPVDSVLTAVSVRFRGASGHGALPAVMPQISLLRYDSAAATLTSTLGSTTDASASTGVFEAAHTLAISGLSHTVDAASYYMLRIIAESGVNSATHATAWSPSFTATITRQNES